MIDTNPTRPALPSSPALPSTIDTTLSDGTRIILSVHPHPHDVSHPFTLSALRPSGELIRATWTEREWKAFVDNAGHMHDVAVCSVPL